jgi:hypothetical protein
MALDETKKKNLEDKDFDELFSNKKPEPSTMMATAPDDPD